MPLDRSGAVPGTIALSVARKLSGNTPSSTAVIALAGGPGQPALPFAEFTAKAMAPALHGRDLLVFDQRGTGSSDPLSCPALESIDLHETIARIFQRCAEQIGPARGAFTSQESVQDIEALRRAAGYSKLVLYGTSYGTKVALEYAERYPQNVEALVLDSVVPPEGREPFSIAGFKALPGALRELCSQGMCDGITREPVADIAALTSRLRHRALLGAVYDGVGHRHGSVLTELGLLAILSAGDLNPALRALLPAAVHAALRGEPNPLLRLQALGEGLIPNIPSGRAPEPAEEDDTALFVVTTCEETPFPWQRAAAPSARLSEALAFLHAQPASDFSPFDARTALRNSLVEACDRWPYASSPPPPVSPLPAVPTLILSGAQDLRTPTAQAQALAARIPGATLLLVPFTGHSVVGSDLSGCAAKGIASFFAGAAVEPCTGASDKLPPTRLAPKTLAAIRPPAGLGGRPGRTLIASLDTMRDLNQQVIAATLQVNARLPSGSSFGGLHGGFARLSSASLVLHRFSLVSGVQLTGSFKISRGRLLPATVSIRGSSAAAGRVRLGGSSSRVSGTLGGRHFDLLIPRAKLSRTGGGEWPSSAPALSPLGREEALAPGDGAQLR